MRTTLDIDDALFQRAKETAARTKRPLREVIEDALRECFSRQDGQEAGDAHAYTLPVSPESGGLCPGVDLDDSAGLLDLMEQGDAPA